VAGAVGLNDCAPRHGREALCPLAVPGLYFNPCGADRAGTTYMSTVLYINATMVGQFSGWVSCFTNLPRRAPDSRGLERISLVWLVIVMGGQPDLIQAGGIWCARLDL
jgi:hypothetical protein